MTRKWIMRALCILCLAAMLTGCGREPEVTETTIEVKKNGQVVHTIIEDFSESYYNLDELESTIQQACDTYNASAGKEAVVLKAAKENDDHTVTVVMQYADASAYSAFNKLALFVGTVKDAFNAGYDLNVTLSSLKGDGEQIGKEWEKSTLQLCGKRLMSEYGIRSGTVRRMSRRQRMPKQYP